VREARALPMSPDTRARAELVAAVCARIRDGAPINHACALEGVTRSVFYEWRDKDPEVARQLAAARAVAAEEMRVELRGLIKTGSRGAAPMLHLMERQHPDEYAPPPKRVEQTGKDGGPQEHVVRDGQPKTREEALARIDALRKQLEGGGS
jgi:hypothetical protein